MKRILSFLFVSLASVALFIACGDEESCLTDEDCTTEGELCIDEVCQDPNANNNNGTNNANNVNNTNQNNTNQNNTNNVNNPPAGSQLLLIEDSSSGAEACDVDDPGSDIWTVVLADSAGTPKGWGSLVVDGTTGDNNQFNLGLNLDGNPPASTAMCPEFNEDNVTALGCLGFVVVEFTGADGLPVQAQDGDQVEVYEFGAPLCPSASTADTYGASLCTDVAAVKDNEDISSCTVGLVSGASGLSTNTVSF